MRLLIISNMEHHHRGNQVVGWGPTVVEIDHLASLFSHVEVVGCLHPGEAPSSALPYQSPKVSFVPVAPAGGVRLIDKLGIVWKYPAYALTILRRIANADVVHVRCPANISMLAIVMLAFLPRPKARWVKFATNWDPTGPEAWSSRFQRAWLRQGWSRAFVTVNSGELNQPAHVRRLVNPCLTETELATAEKFAGTKPPLAPLRLLFVGSLTANKGVRRAVEAVRQVRASGVDARLEIVGDGPERAVLAQTIDTPELRGVVELRGWLPRPSLAEVYGRNHLLLLTSESEGWPKVLSEAMAYGVVPVASAVSCIPYYLAGFGVGRTVPWDQPRRFAEAVLEYARDSQRWLDESGKARQVAPEFGFSRYLREIESLVRTP